MDDPPPEVMGVARSERCVIVTESAVDATETALEAATHLTDMDAGAVAALRRLAHLVDNPVVANDNVTIPTYLKFCESLGLTPAGRLRLGEGNKEAPGGKLAQLRAVNGKARSA